MCGIAGVLGASRPDALARMAGAIAHRGPDGEGVWRDETCVVGLAHRRLSIIDLSSAGTQPMVSADGRYVTIFNGEIFNFQSIAQMLTAARYSFNANSDTAVLAPLYDLKGPDMLHDLEGMYAFAIWDRRMRELFIARDHAGIKPLYYHLSRDTLAFASELKSVRAALGPVSIDEDAVREYLTFLWTPGERTLLREVKKLRPGHYMIARHDGANAVATAITRWYRPPLPSKHGGEPHYDTDKSPARLLGVLDAVVAEQCVSDVPIGAFLSGGVDSSAVVASMVATGHRPDRTYCIGFTGDGMAGEDFNDLKYARLVAGHLNVPLTEVKIDADQLLAGLPGLPSLLDEPTADPAPLLVGEIARQARADRIKVLLSGVGGDDIFSGYRRHVTAQLREKLGPFRGILTMAGRVAGGMGAGALRRRAEKLSGLLGEDDVERLLIDVFRQNSVPGIAGLMRRAPDPVLPNALTEAVEESRGQALLNRMLYMELFGFLPDHNLNYTDKACMAWGVEGRVPLIDRRLIAYMADVPPGMKVKGLDPKWMFKAALASRLPRSVLSRSKVGFGAPIRALLTNGKGRSLMESALFDSAVVRQLFVPDKLEAFWRDAREGGNDGAYAALAIAMIGWGWDALAGAPGERVPA